MIITKREYNILVIEDNPGDFLLIQESLLDQVHRLDIAHAASYSQARDILSVKGNIFDIVLLDLSLPDKTGEKLIEGIIGICPNIPVIVLTGYADFSFGVKSLSLGISDYILKDELTPISLYKSILYSLERKKINLELAESEKRYSDLFRLSPWPMWVYDVDTLMFLNINEAAIAHYGYNREEFLSMTIIDIRPPEDIQIVEETINTNKKENKEYFSGIFNHKKKSGEVIKVEIQSNSIRYKERDAKVILAHNVTERLNYVKAIEEQNDKLKEIAWMQSHVIRAPLARIMALVELIRTEKDDESVKERMLEYMLISANELDDVIRCISDKTTEHKLDEFSKK